MKIPPALSVALTTFAGAFEGFVVSHLGNGMPSLQQIEAIGAGAALAGIAAIVHLYLPVPSAKQVSQ